MFLSLHRPISLLFSCTRSTTTQRGRSFSTNCSGSCKIEVSTVKTRGVEPKPPGATHFPRDRAGARVTLILWLLWLRLRILGHPILSDKGGKQHFFSVTDDFLRRSVKSVFFGTNVLKTSFFSSRVNHTRRNVFGKGGTPS